MTRHPETERTAKRSPYSLTIQLLLIIFYSLPLYLAYWIMNKRMIGNPALRNLTLGNANEQSFAQAIQYRVQVYVSSLTKVTRFLLTATSTRRALLALFFAATLVLVLSFTIPGEAVAQWNKTGSIAASTGNGDGVVINQSGLIWAAMGGQILLSSDQGSSWLDRSNGISAGEGIYDIRFFDQTTGILSTTTGVTYKTTDQGKTWMPIYSDFVSVSCMFGATVNDLILATNGGVSISRDGGTAWQYIELNARLHYLYRFNNLLLSYGGIPDIVVDGRPGKMFRSTDNGATWQSAAGTSRWDSYMFGVDSCGRIYLVNENNEDQGLTDNSNIFASNDLGDSWQTLITTPLAYWSGSIAVTKNAIYCPTTTEGIRRSTDKGITWQYCGGPSQPNDTRLITALTDNVLIAIDSLGTIYRTINGGGTPVEDHSISRSIAVTPATLFSSDSLFGCQNGVIRSVTIKSTFPCTFPRVIGQSLIGAGATSYTILPPYLNQLTGNDSLNVFFQPFGNGVQDATLILQLDDGTVIPVFLKGSAKRQQQLSVAAANASTSIIGDEISIPVTLDHPFAADTIRFQVTYDSQALEFLDARTSSNGVAPSKQVSNRITVSLPLLDQQTNAGALRFRVWYASDSCSQVTLDSLHFTGPDSCGVIATFAQNTYTICGPTGCAAPTISNFMRQGTLPMLRVAPSPARDHIEIYSSEALKNAMLVILDAQGKTVRTVVTDLDPATPHRIPLTGNPAGAYILRLVAGANTSDLEFLKVQ